ncbi:MAG: hypothetical protein [Cressdnaviricota sp.]|nr:MAG: hypothetical protein [Cressdnaviricota sp.]
MLCTVRYSAARFIVKYITVSHSLKRAPALFFLFFFSFFREFWDLPIRVPFAPAAYHIVPRVIFYATCQLLIGRVAPRVSF